MSKIFKFSLFLFLIFCIPVFFTACGRKNEVSSQSNKQALIGDVNYESLTDAVNDAKPGDTIKIYNDLKDNKNVTITKPITIEGVLTSSQIRPRFYGSITINTTGENDTTTIENIEIIHTGTTSDNPNNNTLIGINLIDGGLTLKSNLIGLNEDNIENKENASGVVITRSINSINTMPIVIKGNQFELYKTNNDNLSSAMIIKSAKPGDFKQINLNTEEIYNKNSFSTNGEGNQLIFINHASNPISFPFFMTSSTPMLTKALLSNQNSNGSRFILVPNTLNSQNETTSKILENTNLNINSNKSADLGGATFKVDGSVLINGNIKNATFERTSDTASIIFAEGVDKSGVTII